MTAGSPGGAGARVATLDLGGPCFCKGNWDQGSGIGHRRIRRAQ